MKSISSFMSCTALHCEAVNDRILVTHNTRYEDVQFGAYRTVCSEDDITLLLATEESETRLFLSREQAKEIVVRLISALDDEESTDPRINNVVTPSSSKFIVGLADILMAGGKSNV